MDADWLEVVLKRYERENSIEKIVGVETKSAAPKGQNYVGVVTRATCDVILGSGRKTKRSLIIKGEHSDKKKEALENFPLFKTEILVYRNVLSKMEALMDEFHDKNNHLWCQMIACEDYTQLIFEDLTERGFSVARRQDCLDFDHGVLVLKSLGRFHAMSKILADRRAICDQDYGENIFLVTGGAQMMENFVHGGFKRLATTIKNSWPAERKKFALVIEKQIDIAYNKLVSLAKEECESKFMVLNHGDPWVSNMMFKYSDNSKSPIEMKLIDFQIAYYNSLGWDVVYFLYTSMMPNVRRNSYEKLLKAYWDSLDSNLRFYGYDGQVPSFDEVKTEIDRFGYFSFFVFALYHPLMTAEGTDAYDMEKTKEPDSQAAFNPEMFTTGSFFKHSVDDFEMFANKGII